MGDQRRLWTGDWARYQEAPTEPIPVAKPQPDPRPAARATVARHAEARKTRAWTAAFAAGAGVFAFAFGYIYGEVRAGTDPGLRQASVSRAAQPQGESQQQINPQQQAPQVQPQLPPDQSGQSGQSGSVPGDQGMPPLTTRQS